MELRKNNKIFHENKFSNIISQEKLFFEELIFMNFSLYKSYFSLFTFGNIFKLFIS